MLIQGNTNTRLYFWLIVGLSILVPCLVALLFYIPQTGKLGALDVTLFPHINAILNSATSLSLISGYFFIKNKNIRLHRISMVSAFFLSSLFLIFYVIYHYQGSHTLFGDINHNGIVEISEKVKVSSIRYYYYILLISHIVLAAIVVPFVLFALYFAITNQIVKHKKIVKYTFPIWLYVAVTGVIVYFMIKPYY